MTDSEPGSVRVFGQLRAPSPGRPTAPDGVEGLSAWDPKNLRRGREGRNRRCCSRYHWHSQSMRCCPDAHQLGLTRRSRRLHRPSLLGWQPLSWMPYESLLQRPVSSCTVSQANDRVAWAKPSLASSCRYAGCIGHRACAFNAWLLALQPVYPLVTRYILTAAAATYHHFHAWSLSRDVGM